ncbi:MAG: MarR family transcriptional regulator [Proteobacteria bacterium]|nr:MarR family transcriptional regulator [Pseudomonadota bacterium]
MVDVNPATAGVRALRLAAGGDEPEALRRVMELLFYAYRDITAEPDRLLARHGFGRAHHRAIHFIRRNPGISVAELVEVLRITKQSLARVLRQLVDRGFVVQETDAADRRRRNLYLAARGEALEDQVSAPQQGRLSRAFRDAGPTATDGALQVLWALADETDRAALLRPTAPDRRRSA